MSMMWTAIGTTAVSVGSSFLNKPKAPAAAQYTPVNLVDEQKKAVEGNIGQENNIEALLTQANKFAQGQATDLMNQAVPGYSAYAAKLLKSGSDKLSNPYALPQDVMDNLNRISAERGISRGTAGQANQYSALKDLGVNMLDYGNNNFNQAIQALSAVTGTAPRISPMSPMSFYVTPAQSAQAAQGNNQNQQAIQQGANNANAAASNFGNQNLWDSISKGAGSILGAIASPQTPDPNVTYYQPPLGGNASSAAAVRGGYGSP